MNPYYRMVLMVFRLIGVCLLIMGMLDFALYFLQCRRDGVSLAFGHCLYLSLPLIAGGVVLALSPAGARRVSEYLDD